MKFPNVNLQPKEEEETNRETLRRLVEQAEGFVPALSDADRLTLRNQLDETCDRMNQVSDKSQRKVDELVKNIEQYRKTASQIEQSVNHLTEIQREVRQLLNRPILTSQILSSRYFR